MSGKKDPDNPSERIIPKRSYPEFTTYKYRSKEGGFIQRTIDYVFASREEAQSRMEVVGWLDPPSDDQLNKEMASPCIDQPSDHFAQAYEIEFKPVDTLNDIK